MYLLVSVSAFVSGLLYSRCPSNVSGLVAAVIVDSINRVRPAWLRSDVVYKRLKVVSPFVANSDSASAIVTEARVSGVEAPGFYASPRLVFGRVSVLFGAPMSSCRDGRPLFLEAPTAFGRTFSKDSRSDYCGSAAVATARPDGVTVYGSGSLYSDKATETTAFKFERPGYKRKALAKYSTDGYLGYAKSICYGLLSHPTGPKLAHGLDICWCEASG